MVIVEFLRQELHPLKHQGSRYLLQYKSCQPEGITIAGGEGVVSRGVEDKLKELLPEAELLMSLCRRIS